MDKYFIFSGERYIEVNPLSPQFSNILFWEEDEEQPGYFYAGLTAEDLHEWQAHSY